MSEICERLREIADAQQNGWKLSGVVTTCLDAADQLDALTRERDELRAEMTELRLVLNRAGDGITPLQAAKTLVFQIDLMTIKNRVLEGKLENECCAIIAMRAKVEALQKDNGHLRDAIKNACDGMSTIAAKVGDLHAKQSSPR